MDTQSYIQSLRDDKAISQSFFKKLAMIIPVSKFQKANKIQQLKIPFRYQKNNNDEQIRKMILNQKSQLKDIYQLCSDWVLGQKRQKLKNFIKDLKESCESKLETYKCVDDLELEQILQINKQEVQLQFKNKINQIKKSQFEDIESIFKKFKEAMSNYNYNEVKLINGFIWYIYRSKGIGLNMQQRLSLLFDFVQRQEYLNIKQQQKEPNQEIDQIKEFAKIHIRYKIIQKLQSDFLTFTQFYQYETIKDYTYLRQSLKKLIKEEGKDKNLLNILDTYFQNQNHIHHEYFFIKEKVFNGYLPKSYDNIKASFLNINFKDLLDQIKNIKLSNNIQCIQYTSETEQILLQKSKTYSQGNQLLIIILSMQKGQNYIEQILVNSLCQIINIFLSSLENSNMQIKWVYHQYPSQNQPQLND